MYDIQDAIFVDYVIDNLPYSIFWKCKCPGSNNLVFKGCNKQFAQQFGYDKNEVIGKTDHDFPWSPELRDKYIRDDEMIMRGCTKLNYEEEQKQIDGSIRVLLVSKVPIYSKEKEVVGVLGIYTDITDRKLAEELKIKNETAEAEKVIKFTNLMAGSMAHELRTPLAVINTCADLFKNTILSDASPAEKENHCLQMFKKIKRVIKSAVHMVNDMLLKLRSFAIGKLPQSDFTELAMADSVAKFMQSYPFEENEKQLVKVITDDIFSYYGDELLTEHLLANLIKNALKAIHENDGKGNITIELKTEDDYNKILIRDTATGISEEFIPKIFDQFATTRAKSGGTGLGLAFCKMVMEYYGGTITCTSEKGKYTEFVLNFPKVGQNLLRTCLKSR